MEAGLDQVKWVDGDDCSTTGITGVAGSLEDATEFDLVYFESTGFTAQAIAFPGDQIGGPYVMCCELHLLGEVRSAASSTLTSTVGWLL